MSTYLNYSIQTKESFKQWILRKLGEPLITVELTDEQLDDAINDAVEIFTKYCAQENKYIAIDVSEYIEDTGYKLPDNVTGIFSFTGDTIYPTGINTLFSVENQLYNVGMMPDFTNLARGGGWVSYELAMQSLDLTKLMTGKGYQFEYNPRTKYLTLIPDPKKQNLQGYIVVGCNVIRSETMQYGEDWVKKMALALAKQTLGNIRKKFDGVQLLGGGSIDTSIGDEGKQEEDNLMEKLQEQEGPVFGMWVSY